MRLAGAIHYLWLVKSDIRMPALYGIISHRPVAASSDLAARYGTCSGAEDQSGETCGRALGLCQPQPGSLRKNKLSLYHLNAAPGIVRDQQITVQICVIHQR